MSALYVISLPVGHPDDITVRALRLLRECALIVAADDVEAVRAALAIYEIHKVVIAEGERERSFAVLNEGGAVALVTSEGTPGFEAGGLELIRAAVARGARVEPVPGANAHLPALVASGMATDQFVYVGALDAETIARYAHERMTIIGQVTPGTLAEVLAALGAHFDAAHPVCAALDLSRPAERFHRETVGEIAARFAHRSPNGPFTLVIAGVSETAERWDKARVLAALDDRLRDGESPSYAAKQVANAAGWKKSEVYALLRNT
jgi:16S rRNA (cytidine1402-2'-O)-methyltransferase